MWQGRASFTGLSNMVGTLTCVGYKEGLQLDNHPLHAALMLCEAVATGMEMQVCVARSLKFLSTTRCIMVALMGDLVAFNILHAFLNLDPYRRLRLYPLMASAWRQPGLDLHHSLGCG
jgi:hypothetical protein